MTGLAALAFAGLGAAAPATPALPDGAPVVLPCAPPAGVALRFTLTQHFVVPEGRTVAVTVHRRLRFGQDAAGLFLDAGPASAETDDKGARAARLAAIYDGSGPAPMRVRLGARAQVVGIVGEDAHWAAFLARQRGLLATAPDAGDARARLAYEALSGASPARRRAILTGFLEPVTRFCGRIVADALARDGAHILRSEGRPADAGGIAEEISYRIDTRTGLAVEIRRIATPAADPARRLVERWTLAPEP